VSLVGKSSCLLLRGRGENTFSGREDVGSVWVTSTRVVPNARSTSVDDMSPAAGGTNGLLGRSNGDGLHRSAVRA
jgi:hypothetical protein